MKVGKVITEIWKKIKNPYDFVKVVDTNTIIFLEKQNLSDPNTLQKVNITAIPFNTTTIWLLDKLEAQITGFTPYAAKTPEVLFCIPDFTTKKLYVYFVEMKSKFRTKQLTDTYDKFRDVLTRFFFLLILNERPHQQKPQYLELDIAFRGLVFYMADDPTNLVSVTNFHNSLQNNTTIKPSLATAFLSGKGIIDFPDTFLGHQKVETKFFPVPFGQIEFTINYEDLITNF